MEMEATRSSTTMTEEILSLKWNNHRTTFFHVLSNVRLKEAYSDATVACEGKFFPVHKLVMSSCSDYFEQIFQVVQCRHPVIVLKDITHQHMDLLLSYMYLGEVKVCMFVCIYLVVYYRVQARLIVTCLHI
ncbi:Longitudinals lacking protein-like [Portunus trituberculatus]|uniref:Longitudinals lacking protein-like n=1 Tax=Portunus trituberculatus TaxID=210409 RepID=A0A5B7DUZ6_PORTR|nr:Longitudinals lacking protein-like [Portunus trituberculatus]